MDRSESEAGSEMWEGRDGRRNGGGGAGGGAEHNLNDRRGDRQWAMSVLSYAAKPMSLCLASALAAEAGAAQPRLTKSIVPASQFFVFLMH